MKILLLSAYDAASHHHWHSLLRRSFGEYQWTVLTLPPRYFSWRQRGNSLSWAFGAREQLEADYDLLIATSLVDLSALRGFVPSLGHIPTIVYFHENQFAYPASERQNPNIEPRLLNLYTALCADRILFNSEYNRQTLMAGVTGMLNRFPDCVPGHLPDYLAARSEVLPVPLAPDCFGGQRPEREPPLRILWNHRWEYDKGPERLLAIVEALQARRLPAIWHVVGQQFRSRPPEFGRIRNLLDQSDTQQCGRWGFIRDRSEYRELLLSADIALSTAVHDFQGLAVQEAVAAGCLPLVPDRLCYSEWFDTRFRYPSCDEDIPNEAEGVAQRLIAMQSGASPVPAPDLAALSMDSLKGRYRAVLEAVAGTNAHGQLFGE